MTLMHSSANRSAGADSYAAKRSLYENSGFEITKKLAKENMDWSPESIAMRQSWMADQVTSIWRIAQLD